MLERNLLSTIQKAEDIFDSDCDWEYKYDRIFGMAPTIRSMMSILGLSLDYYDPDTSYQEDVTAYINALRDLKENLQKEIGR